MDRYPDELSLNHKSKRTNLPKEGTFRLELTLAQRQPEKVQWTHRLISPLQEIENGPDESRMLIGGGILLLLRQDANRLVVELVHTEAERTGYRTIGNCTVRYQGRELGAQQAQWLDTIIHSIERFGSDSTPDWSSYLQWATRQPSRGFGVESKERTAQGTELLVRLLEPCQARCNFCICRSAQPDMVSSADDIEERLVDGREAGMERVVFTGGEPTLVRELGELIKRARSLGYRRIGIQTNGLKLADPDYAKHLMDCGLDSILQSLHSHDPKIHESIFQIDGCFEDCVTGAKNALALGLNLNLNYVTTIANQNGHLDFIDFVHTNLRRPHRWRFPHRQRYPGITFSAMSPQGWGATDPTILPRLTEVAASVRKAVVQARKQRIIVRVPGLCGFPACLLPDLAFIFDELQEQESVQLESRRFFDDCEKCAFYSRCSGYWKGYINHHGTAEFRPALASRGYRIPRRWFWQPR